MRRLLIKLHIFSSDAFYFSFLAIAFFLALNSNATTYYVSNAGSDSNPGTSSKQPWQTLDKVNGIVPKPGDSILFKKGDEWIGTITVNFWGKEGNPIVFGAYGEGAKPKIYGSEKIYGWTKYAGNIYKASFTKNINQLFIDDVRMRAARWPNTGYAKIDSKKNEVSFVSDALKTSINYVGAKWFGRTGVYHTEIRTITAQSQRQLTLDSSVKSDLDVEEGFILMNKLEFLDQAEEWFYDEDSETVYLWTPDGDSPDNYTVRGSTIDYGLFSAHDYIKIQEIEFLHQAHTAIYTKERSFITIDDVAIHNPDRFGVFNMTSRKGNFYITNSKIVGANHQGIHLRMPGIKVSDSEILNIALFENIGLSGNGNYYYGTALYAVGEGSEIKYNRIENAGYNGIFFADSNNKIEYNYINNTSLLKGDGGGIYATQPKGANPTTGSVVRYNIVLNSLGSNAGIDYRHFSNGIYIDESAHGVTVEYNTVFRSSDAGIKLHKTDATIVRHNTIMDSRYAIQIVHSSGSTPSRISNNILYSTSNGCIDKYEPRQLLFRVSSANAVIENNIYRNPYENKGVFREEHYLDFEKWKLKTGYDSKSRFKGHKLSGDQTEKLFYNDTKKLITFNLGNKVYYDIHGNPVSGSFSLEPFTSKILIGADFNLTVEN